MLRDTNLHEQYGAGCDVRIALLCTLSQNGYSTQHRAHNVLVVLRNRLGSASGAVGFSYFI